MLRAQRHYHISQALAEHGVVRVRELVSRFRVTSETIRRDLEELEQQGRLVRTHGGAMLNAAVDEPFEIRRQANGPAKQAIARRALPELVGHDVIGLDASTSSLALARILPDEPRTVITNALPIAMELASKPAITTVVTGGVLDRETLGLHGAAATEILSRFSISVAFVSCFGYDPRRGAGEATELRATFKRALITASDRVVLLADRSKFTRRPSFFFCPPDQIDRIIREPGGVEQDGDLSGEELASFAAQSSSELELGVE